ncbi:MAG: hypothetical protein ACTMIR_05790 [Cellulomonadaceae bacterium]
MPRRPGVTSPVQLRPVLAPRLLRAADAPADVIRALVLTQQRLRVRRGVYIDMPTTTDHELRRELAVARAFAVALANAGRDDLVISHTSAALLWGLPLIGAGRTHVTRPVRPSGTHARDVIRHTTVLGEEDVVEHLGVRVTTLARTVADCALLLPPVDALIIADAALHVGAERDLCLDRLSARGRVRGARRAEEILLLADDGAESPGESRARFPILAAGIAMPATQVRTDTPNGTYWSDLGIEEAGLLVEYDGAEKYTAQGSATAAVLRERRRDHDLERAGWRMLHVDNQDLRDTEAYLDLVIRHLPSSMLRDARPRFRLLTR